MPFSRKSSQKRLDQGPYKQIEIRKEDHIEFECTKLSTPEPAKTRDRYNQLNRRQNRGLEGQNEIDISPDESWESSVSR